MPALFEFVEDRAPQGSITGPFAPVADQSQFKSIYGVLSGPQTGPFTAQQIENGQIYSGDGRARMGGEPVRNSDGTFHDVQSGSTVFREFQIPNDVVEKWNEHERRQSDEQCRSISQKGFGENVKGQEFKQWDEQIETPSIKYKTTQVQVPSQAPTSDKRKAALANARAAKAAKKAAESQVSTPQPT